MRAAAAKFWIVAKTSFKNLVAERFDILIHLAYLPLLAIILYYIWGIIFTAQGNNFGFSFNEIIAYVLVAVLLRRIIQNSHVVEMVEEDITEGRIITYLCRPLNYFNFILARRSAQTLLFAAIIIPLILATTVFLNAHSQIVEFFLGVLLTGIAALFTTVEFYCLGLLAFWIERVWGIKHAVDWAQEFLSGTLFPITLFPLIVQDALVFLPFKYLVYTPTMLFIGKAGAIDALVGIAVLGIWTIALVLLARLLWKAGLKKHDGKG